MKKGMLLTLLVVGVVCRASAQGLINFANATSAYGTNILDHLVRFGLAAAIINPALPFSLVSSNPAGFDLTGLRAQLFYGASTINALESLTPVTDAPATFRASTSANAGSWLGGTRTLFGFNPGDTVHLNVFVWDIRATRSFAGINHARRRWALRLLGHLQLHDSSGRVAAHCLFAVGPAAICINLFSLAGQPGAD
jgi:hypothetical protein